MSVVKTRVALTGHEAVRHQLKAKYMLKPRTVTRFSLNRIFVFVYDSPDELSDIPRWEDKKLSCHQSSLLFYPHCNSTNLSCTSEHKSEA